MQADFWHQKWQKNEIGFHLADANPLLVKHFHKLNLKPKFAANFKPRIFLPLCGKTLDIAWLLAQGYSVAGAELSRIAIEDLFKNLNLTPDIKILGEVTLFSAANIDIFVCDIFKLTPAMLGAVDAVYDRAALVALPSEMRKRYTAHLMALINRAPQLLICFEYDQSLCDGPPFSISPDEVKQHYQTSYSATLLASVAVAGGLKGQCPATELVWWLQP
jgi:thiopurine S-methyltransferase